jgi:hypothetical protein
LKWSKGAVLTFSREGNGGISLARDQLHFGNAGDSRNAGRRPRKPSPRPDIRAFMSTQEAALREHAAPLVPPKRRIGAPTPWPMPATTHGADWLGHRSIQHTTRYTQFSAAPFKDSGGGLRGEGVKAALGEARLAPPHTIAQCLNLLIWSQERATKNCPATPSSGAAFV